MTDKKARNITPTGFLSKLSKTLKMNKSAQGFLDQNREFLLSGSLQAHTNPILIKADSGEIDPEKAINEMMKEIFAVIQSDHEKSLLKSQEVKTVSVKGPKAPREKKANLSPVIATIYDENGVPAIMLSENGKEVDPEKGFHLGQEAERWVDRRLVFDVPSGSYGEIVHVRVMLKGEPMKDVVSREDSFLRLNGRQREPIMKRQTRSVSRLKSVMRVHESRFVFSGA